jgi:hypothetical protein
MDTNQDILNFAIKWFDKFRHVKSVWSEGDDIAFAFECSTLGFEVDRAAFESAYPDSSAFNDYQNLDAILENIDDIEMLGSMIFSKWSELRESVSRSGDILSLENRVWFIMAFLRLEDLSHDPGESPLEFCGKAVKLELISNRICRGFHPAPNDEVEQHLTITADGSVHFSSCRFGDGRNGYQVARNDRFQIAPKKALKILRAVEETFSGEFDESFDMNAGDWELMITNLENGSYHFRGAICSDSIEELDHLSQLIRSQLECPELCVFDGKQSLRSQKNHSLK